MGPYIGQYLAAGAVTVQVQLRTRATMETLHNTAQHRSIAYCCEAGARLAGPTP